MKRFSSNLIRAALVLTLSLFPAAATELPAYEAFSDAAPSMEQSLYKLMPGSTRQLELLDPPPDSGESFLWASSDPSVVQVDDTGLATGVAYGTATVVAVGRASGIRASCTVKVCDVKQVAITFDDGPSSHTARLLDFLKENEISATFFLVGNRVPAFEEVVRRQAAEGHEIGYHSYSHKNHTKLSCRQIKGEFEDANRQLQALTGIQYTLWRSPGGNYDQRVLDCIPLPHIRWSVDTQDWATRDADAVYTAIVSGARDGAIILLHDLYGSSVKGAIRAIAALNQGDFEFLTVTELLSRDGRAPEKCMNYNQN